MGFAVEDIYSQAHFRLREFEVAMKEQWKSAFLFLILTGVSAVGFALPAAKTYDVVNTCKEEEPLVRGKLRLSALTGLPVGPSAKVFSSPSEKILRPFQSDGCSSSPNGVTGTANSQVWTACCVAHDTAYWKGGTFQEKVKADQALKACMADAGYPRVATFFSATVQQLGGPNTHQSFRWGYGWNYKRGYSPLTAQENKQIEGLYSVSAQDIEAYLFANTVQLFEACNSNDPAFTPLSGQEELIFKDLNYKLKTDTVIRSAEVANWNLEKKVFEVRVDGCERPMTYIFKIRSNDLLSVDSSCF